MILVRVLAPCRSASGPISPTEEGALLTDGIRAAVEWPAPILAVTFHMPESREQAAVALHRLCLQETNGFVFWETNGFVYCR